MVNIEFGGISIQGKSVFAGGKKILTVEDPELAWRVVNALRFWNAYANKIDNKVADFIRNN